MFPFFKSKPRNRRFTGQEGVLDVKLRVSKSRAARARVAGAGLAAFFALAIAAAVCWRAGQALLDRLVYENDAFAIQQIDVKTDGVLTTEIIRRWAGAHQGENLMALDLMAVKSNLEAQPPVQFAAVERVLPHTLRLIVTERDPIAQTFVTRALPNGKQDQAVYDFDADGFAMTPVNFRWRTSLPAPNETLPVLVGVQAGDIAPGRQIESTQVRAALRLIDAFDRSPMVGLADIAKINVAMPEILLATTGQGAQITFSLDHFDVQLRRWRLIYDQYQRWGRAIATADLSISNNIPVRWVAANAAATPAPKMPVPHRTRKKNV